MASTIKAVLLAALALGMLSSGARADLVSTNTQGQFTFTTECCHAAPQGYFGFSYGNAPWDWLVTPGTIAGSVTFIGGERNNIGETNGAVTRATIGNGAGVLKAFTTVAELEALAAADFTPYSSTNGQGYVLSAWWTEQTVGTPEYFAFDTIYQGVTTIAYLKVIETQTPGATVGQPQTDLQVLDYGYVTPATASNDVTEPGAVALLALGGLGVAGFVSGRTTRRDIDRTDARA